MAEYLEKILPGSPKRWYPLNEVVSNGQNADVVLDKSAAGAHLISAASFPSWSVPTVNKRNSVYFDGVTNPLKNTTPFSAKHVFCLVKKDLGTPFSTFRGLLTGLSDSNFGIFVGASGTTKFVDFDYETFGTYVYRKSQTPYLENNLQAPFEKFELLEASLSVGWNLDGLQIGQDRANAARKWQGRVCEVLIYDRVLTAAEINAVNLYFDLKFGLWRANNTILNFPNPNLTRINYNRFWASNPDFDKVTAFHEYEDGGRSYNETSVNAPRTWEVSFDCTGATHAEARSKADIFDAFDSEARRARTFSFTDKYGVTHQNVRINDYDRVHSVHKSFEIECKFRLVKYP